MTRFYTVRCCPLTAQFWFLGVDARQGDLALRGFSKARAAQGSSRYTLGDLSLHSAGLTLQTPRGPLHFNRRTQTFTLAGQHVPLALGRTQVRAALQGHERWIEGRYGPGYRPALADELRPPRPVRAALPAWQAWHRGSLAEPAPLAFVGAGGGAFSRPTQAEPHLLAVNQRGPARAPVH
ncbi:hypothetical protein [Deinococcus multiflagellatus]|uniref:Uncharacterized protein n=1 Tax=Deinococcus multiflagellatus TaxID=1656887 RepID=A0ABW1ZET3_9DEIO|nr:hypothetical protein [Deinococcus multiflagellatus]MBZ9712722.1 hypothetical protein [Deinococcus multiflagellatus]